MVAIERKRRFLPATYNAAREHEQPIPLIAPTENAEEITEENIESISEIMQAASHQEEDLQETIPEVVDGSSREYIKLNVDEEDMAAFEDLFGDVNQLQSQAVNDNDALVSSGDQDSTISSSVLQASFLRSIRIESTCANIEPNAGNGDGTTGGDFDEPNAAQNQRDEAETESDDEQARKKQIESNLQEVLLRGEIVILDEDLEYISIPGQQLRAIQCKPVYRTKANDPLCGNRPFKDVVCLSGTPVHTFFLMFIHFHCVGWCSCFYD